ncbi:MAG: sigma-70 family RNA polymerase sigma factor [Chloroflexota bacterium]|nr:sigma-70 family RNA polymerase sigma factor [Chloroflexota bacterium]
MAEPSAVLVQRAQAGDREAMAELVQSQQTYVFSIAMSLMHNPADAADMTQDSFIRLMRSLGTYRAETKFTTWLYRLVTNICLDGLRRRGRPVESLDDLGPQAHIGDGAQSAGERLADTDRWTQPEELLELRESATEVREALQQLPAVQSLTLTLHYFEDLRYEDIADVTGLPLNTVKSHIRRGKERLAQLLTHPVEDQPCSART